MKKFNLLDNVYFMCNDFITHGKIIGLASKKSTSYWVEVESESKVKLDNTLLYSDINELLTFLSNNVVK